MDHIKGTLNRMKLQQIRSFLLEGDDGDIKNQSFEERLEDGEAAICNRLESLYPGIEELDNAMADLFNALTAYETVYMELGMKAGARLLLALLYQDDGT